MENDPETVPQKEPKRARTHQKKDFVVKVYLNDARERDAVLKGAVEGGFRRGGLPEWTKKPHGWEGELVANTDGLSSYLKDCAAKVAAANELSRILKQLVNKR